MKIQRAIMLLLAFAFIGLSAAMMAQASDLAQGSKGEEVEEVQKRLTAWGYYDGAIDGKFGKDTVDAVKRFQRKNGLDPTGKVDERTAAALGAQLIERSNSRQSETDSRFDNPVTDKKPAKSDDHDVELLARLIYSSANDQPYNCKVAIGAVALNRVNSPLFPNTLSGVIYQPDAFDSALEIYGAEPDQTSIKAARDAMNGFDPSNGAIFYYDPKKTTDETLLNRSVLATIGSFKFCA